MELPIFPLNGAVLFPETSLPLNIFESRYIEMVNYALTRDRYIGMIQTDNNNKLYKIGCIGRIHSFNETGDGRYLISLLGINCFNVVEELKQTFSFRIVKAEILQKNEVDKNKLNEDKKFDLFRIYKKYIDLKKIGIDINEIEKIDCNQAMKFIAMVSPFENTEKQLLLETNNDLDFYNKLISMIELEINGIFDNTTIN